MSYAESEARTQQTPELFLTAARGDVGGDTPTRIKEAANMAASTY
jgi:hypothetical protein